MRRPRFSAVTRFGRISRDKRVPFYEASAATIPGVRRSPGPVLRARGPQTVLVKRYVPKLGQFGKGGVVVRARE